MMIMDRHFPVYQKQSSRAELSQAVLIITKLSAQRSENGKTTVAMLQSCRLDTNCCALTKWKIKKGRSGDGSIPGLIPAASRSWEQATMTGPPAPDLQFKVKDAAAQYFCLRRKYFWVIYAFMHVDTIEWNQSQIRMKRLCVNITLWRPSGRNFNMKGWSGLGWSLLWLMSM